MVENALTDQLRFVEPFALKYIEYCHIDIIFHGWIGIASTDIRTVGYILIIDIDIIIRVYFFGKLAYPALQIVDTHKFIIYFKVDCCNF